MTSKVLIPFGDQWLALTLEQYQEAIQRGTQLIPSLATTSVQNADDTPVWLSVPQVARLCNVSETHLYDEIRLGHRLVIWIATMMPTNKSSYLQKVTGAES
jgi:hypothetical protein